MLLVRLVVCFPLLICFICANIIIPQPPSTGSIKMCIEKIRDQYLNSTDFILLLNLNDNFKNLRLNIEPIIIQTNYTKILTSFHLAKANGYIITISENCMQSVFEQLVRSSHWNPRTRFIIILNGNPTNLFKILNKYYVLNAIVLVPISEDETEIFTYFPFDFSVPESRRTDAVSQDFCFNGELQRKVNLFPEKLPQKWNNFTVRIVLMEYPPYIICHNCKDTRKLGLELRVLKAVQRTLGFKIQYVNKSHNHWGYQLTNGSFTGAYGDLQNDIADIGIGLFYGNVSEYWNFDLSYPYMEDSYKWVVPYAELQPQWMGVIKIYGPYVWLTILILLIIISLLLYTSASHLELRNYKVLSICFLVCLQCLLSQFVKQPKTAITRFILILWVLFTWLLTCAFQSHLTSALNFNSYGKQISTDAELVDSKLNFGFYGSSSYLFLNSLDKTDSYIYQHHVACPLNSFCLNRTAFQGDFATLKVERQIHYLITNYYLEFSKDPLIYIFDDQVCGLLINMAFSKGFPMFEAINKLLKHMKYGGVIQRLYENLTDFFEMMYSKAELIRQDTKYLELKEVGGIFYLLLIGWIISLVVFIMELIFRDKYFL